MSDKLVLGIDVGTQGARVVVVDAAGAVVAQASCAWDEVALPDLPAGHIEQHPAAWWDATASCLRQAIAQLNAAGRAASDIVAGAVDSTSGTIALLDENNEPLRPALMYNDRRAQQEADDLNAGAADFCAKVGYRFNSSFALPKLWWLARHEPAVWRRAHRIVHAADYIVGRLTGEFGVTDQSNALKTGFDLVAFAWPGFIEAQLGIAHQRLPRVMRSGTPIASVSAACAAATGLSGSTTIVAGMTDGSADQVASGAHRTGDWNTVLGTTIILKGLTSHLLKDPQGRVYCHLHPQGYWMPGGAGNVGARVLDERFPGVDKKQFDEAALQLSPTDLTVYPLVQTGERFPFVNPAAVGFVERETFDTATLYAAHLEGVACVERLAYDVVRELGAQVGERIYTTGGGARSLPWMQLRADILGRELARAANANAAMGSAIIAAGHGLHADLAHATAAMVQLDSIIQPRPALRPRYDALYERFITALRQRHYL